MKSLIRKKMASCVAKALGRYLKTEACATSSIAAYEHEVPRELKKYKRGNMKCAKG